MKEYLILLSQYNKAADDAILGLVGNMPAEELNKDRGSFAKSLIGLIDHLAGSNVFFETVLKDGFPNVKSLSHKYSAHKMEFGKINFPEPDKLKDVLTVTDKALIEAAKAFSEKDFEKEIRFKGFKGEMVQKTALLYLRLINHATHHRGQISQILDEMKIEHDFSGIQDSY
jgi:uncharacterized damage-inducible protein DinB